MICSFDNDVEDMVKMSISFYVPANNAAMYEETNRRIVWLDQSNNSFDN